ncbi:DUF1491 family protein [Azospirillaceae bacterium]
MSDDRLPTSLWVQAHLRIGAVQGVPMTVVRKGDPERGTVLLKIYQGMGQCFLLSQTRRDERLGWLRSSGPDPISESDAERSISRQIAMDPDLWVIEIEDRQGRCWFDGPVW